MLPTLELSRFVLSAAASDSLVRKSCSLDSSFCVSKSTNFSNLIILSCIFRISCFWASNCAKSLELLKDGSAVSCSVELVGCPVFTGVAVGCTISDQHLEPYAVLGLFTLLAVNDVVLMVVNTLMLACKKELSRDPLLCQTGTVGR